MNVVFSAVMLLAATFLAGCANQEKAEYQKEIDAVPLPQTEVERVQQCKYFNARAQEIIFKKTLELREQLVPFEFGLLGLPFFQRMTVMKCTREDRVLFPKGF